MNFSSPEVKALASNCNKCSKWPRALVELAFCILNENIRLNRILNLAFEYETELEGNVAKQQTKLKNKQFEQESRY